MTRPLDKIQEIRRRYLQMQVVTSSHWFEPKQMHQDIGTLLAEIERLRGAAREALNALDNCIEKDYGHRCNRCDSEIDEGHHVRKALRLALGDP